MNEQKLSIQSRHTPECRLIPIRKVTDRSHSGRSGLDVVILEEIRKLCSHDIKSPICAVQESSKLFFEIGSDHPLSTELIQNTAEAIGSLMAMIQRIQVMASLQDGVLPFQKRPVNLLTCLREVRQSLEPVTVKSGTRITIVNLGQSMFTDSHAYRMRIGFFLFHWMLQQILQCLIEEMPRGETLIVEVCEGDGDNVQVRIKGSGTAIPQAILDIENVCEIRPGRHILDEPVDNGFLLHKLMQMTDTKIAVKKSAGSEFDIWLFFAVMPSECASEPNV